MLAKMLDRHGLTLGKFKIPDRVGDGTMPADMLEADAAAPSSDANITVALDHEQRAFVRAVLTTVDEKKPGMFALDAPAGYGKTKTLNALIDSLKARKKNIAVTAASGVAAQLLTDGRTVQAPPYALQHTPIHAVQVHSTFRVPAREIDARHVLSEVKHNSRYGTLVANLDVLIIDECFMLDKHILMAIDRAFRFIRQNEEHMGGVITVFGGDVRQVLPVLPSKTLAEVKTRIIKCTPWWSRVQQFKLMKNYRVHQAYGRDKKGADEWAQYLLDIGNGDIPLEVKGKNPTPYSNLQ